MKSLKEIKNFLEDESFDLEHEAAMVQSRFLSPIIAAIEDNHIKQGDLAEATGLAQPFISALLNVRKKLSMEHIALFQKALGIILQAPDALPLEEHQSKFYSEKEYEINLQTKKLDLIQWLSTIENPTIIEKILAIRANEREDWWANLSALEKESINKGIEDADAENQKDHDQALGFGGQFMP